MQLSIDSVTTTVVEGEPGCVAVRADSFPNIAAVEFNVIWDTTQFDFAEVRFGDNPLDLNAGRASFTGDTIQRYKVAFITEDLSGITLDPGTVLFDLCLVNKPGLTLAEGRVSFTDGQDAPMFAQEGTVEEFPTTAISGFLSLSTESTGIFTPRVEPSWSTGLKLYPNPSTAGPLFIDGEGLPRLDAIHVFSVAGRRVRSFAGNLRRLDLGSLPAGEYSVRLVAGPERVSRMIIKL